MDLSVSITPMLSSQSTVSWKPTTHPQLHGLRSRATPRRQQAWVDSQPRCSATKEQLRAPGSESNFTGLPKRKEDIPITSKVSSKEMQEHIDLVRTNFQYVFKDIMDLDHFEENIFFSDPITRFTFFRGYQFTVEFLRYFLAPIYELHEVKQAGENAIVIKWSWTMNFWWNRYNPLKNIWDPRLVFTGFTVLGYNPATGKWNKHVDGWDALEDQEFFSVEGFSFVAAQMLQLSKPPNRVTPEFMILKKYKDWEIRRYKPFLVAEVDSAQTSLEEAEEMLRDYFRGANAEDKFIRRTTPLFRDSGGKLFLMLPGYVEEKDAPAPKNEAVKLRTHPGGWFAAGLRGGIPTDKDIEKQVDFVRARAKEEGSQPLDKEPWVFARYNEPKWPRGPFRRNDFLVPIEESSIQLWRGVPFDFIERVVDQEVS